MLRATGEHGTDRRTKCITELDELIDFGLDRRAQTQEQCRDVAAGITQGLPNLSWSEARMIGSDKSRFQRRIRTVLKEEMSIIRQERFIDEWLKLYPSIFDIRDLSRPDFRPLSENDPERDPFAWLVMDYGRLDLEKILKELPPWGLEIDNSLPSGEMWHRRNYCNVSSSLRLVHLLDEAETLSLTREHLAKKSETGISLRELLLLLLLLKFTWGRDSSFGGGFWKRLPRTLKKPILCLGSGFKHKIMEGIIPVVEVEKDKLYVHAVRGGPNISEAEIKKFTTLRVHPHA